MRLAETQTMKLTHNIIYIHCIYIPQHIYCILHTNIPHKNSSNTQHLGPNICHSTEFRCCASLYSFPNFGGASHEPSQDPNGNLMFSKLTQKNTHILLMKKRVVEIFGLENTRNPTSDSKSRIFVDASPDFLGGCWRQLGKRTLDLPLFASMGLVYFPTFTIKINQM